MSHLITEIDTVLRPEGSKYRTWHGLDTEVHQPITMQVAREFGLLPVVEKSPLFVGNGERVENFKALTPQHERKILAIRRLIFYPLPPSFFLQIVGKKHKESSRQESNQRGCPIQGTQK